MAPFRRVLLGRRLASDETHHTKVNNFIGLAVFSSDALSSVAYATQEILASLSASSAVYLGPGIAAVGVAGILGMSVPVAFAIVGLLAILGTSYRQTIIAYPGGGGAYIVAKDNLGESPALVAGASLLTDYVLTVAVSVSSGIAAVTAALPGLRGLNVTLTIVAIIFICVANLRGVKESGALFSIPTYGFIASMMLMLGIGFSRWVFGGNVPLPAPTAEQAAHAVEAVQNLSGIALIWIFMRA
jgi:amino acid transporter